MAPGRPPKGSPRASPRAGRAAPGKAPGPGELAEADTAVVIAQVQRGFPYDFVVRLRRKLDLPIEQIADYVQIKPRTLSRRRTEGRLRPDESERVLRLYLILDRATRLFDDDEAAARRWLSSPKAALGGQTPLAYQKTEPGAREVERLIGRLEHGVYP